VHGGPQHSPYEFAVVAHKTSETNDALAGAAASLGLPASVLSPRDALRTLEPGDIALGRLDVRDELDGIERGTEELKQLAMGGAVLLNPPSALVAAHDNLLTARILRQAGVPHPRTWGIAEGAPSPAPELPVALKPRFGSWGRDVVLCPTAADLDRELARCASRPWFREHGALAQKLIPPRGWDLRVVVSGGAVVGGARRIAAPGEWRTNVAPGGHIERAAPPPLARKLALDIDLLPLGDGFVVSEVNGAIDFRPAYALGPATSTAAPSTSSCAPRGSAVPPPRPSPPTPAA
jgi:glutathione synthase/RimK-type ligase-like ATP-grasp enzyme